MSEVATVQSRVQVIMGANKGLVQAAFSMEVETEADLSIAADLLGEIKSRLKSIEAKRLEYTKPINESLKSINADFKKASEPLQDAETSLRGRIVGLQSRLEREKRDAAEAERKRIEEELRAKAEEAAAIGNAIAAERFESRAQSVAVKAEEVGRGGFTGAKTTIVRRWVFDVMDIAALAAARPDFVMANSPAINAAIRDGVREVPGIVIRQEEGLSVRS